MDENSLKSLWQKSNAVLDAREAANYDKIVNKQLNAAKGQLKQIRAGKALALMFGGIWVAVWLLILVRLIITGGAGAIFLASMAGQTGLTAGALILYGHQLVMIRIINQSGSLLTVQKRLAKLRSSTLLTVRLLLLQLPLWTVFHINSTMWLEWAWWQWVIQWSITGIFALASIWFFLNITYKNKEKKWFKLLLRGKEWEMTLSACKMLEEIEQFSTDAEKTEKNKA